MIQKVFYYPVASFRVIGQKKCYRRPLIHKQRKAFKVTHELILFAFGATLFCCANFVTYCFLESTSYAKSGHFTRKIISLFFVPQPASKLFF